MLFQRLRQQPGEGKGSNAPYRNGCNGFQQIQLRSWNQFIQFCFLLCENGSLTAPPEQHSAESSGDRSQGFSNQQQPGNR